MHNPILFGWVFEKHSSNLCEKFGRQCVFVGVAPRKIDSGVEWACHHRFPTVINAHNQTVPRIFFSLSFFFFHPAILEKHSVRARPFDTRARIKKIELEHETLGRASRLLSVLPFFGGTLDNPGNREGPFVSRFGRENALSSTLPSYIGGVLGRTFSVARRHYACRMIARQCHPTRCSRIQIVTASRNLSRSTRGSADEQWSSHSALRFQRPPPRCL